MYIRSGFATSPDTCRSHLPQYGGLAFERHGRYILNQTNNLTICHDFTHFFILLPRGFYSMSGSFIINKALDSGVLSANETAQLFVDTTFF